MTVDEMLRTGDRVEWRKFLATCTMQEAVTANIKAGKVRGCEDMRSLAFERMGHLHGDQGLPERWP